MKQGVHILLCFFYTAVSICCINAAPANNNTTDPSLEESSISTNSNGHLGPTDSGTNSTAMQDTSQHDASEDDLIIFEGDIKISKQMVLEHYNFSSVADEEILKEFMGVKNDSELKSLLQRSKRGATRYSSLLWPNNQVRYRISSSISFEGAQEIRHAIEHWEDHTCLRFTQVTGGGDYIEFTNTAGAGCFSRIGRQGGRQDINLDFRCFTLGIIAHEIGHAVGFWHEQSRPDRDRYVTIHLANIKQKQQHNFMKRADNEVNSLGSDYDYGSIMHYGKSAFNKDDCNGDNCTTLSVNNTAEYQRQGSPHLGQRIALSTEDINQANILYTCPGIGVRGFLLFRIRSGRSLPDTDPPLNYPDPFVKLTSVDSSRTHYYHSTAYQSGTTDPIWNEWVGVSDREWYFFRIQVWDADDSFTGADDPMTLSETFEVENGTHYSLKHCENTACNGYVLFDYRLLTTKTGKLKFYVKYAQNLVYTDVLWNNPDPYVKIKSKYSSGSSSTRSTRYIDGTTSPSWYVTINFGCTDWAYSEIQIWDSDYNADDAMSDKELIFIQPGSHYNQRHNAHGRGYLIYNYHFIIDGNECLGNPCQNGGTCIDQCASYRCLCPHGYTGTRCDHPTGRLRAYARYGRNLPDVDGWWNDSDPYMEFIAVDHNGRSVRLVTSYRQGDHDPNWNQWVEFGTRSWRQLRVRVYDSDDNADDPMSNSYNINLYHPGVSRHYVRHNCYSGYVMFDYFYV